MSFKRFHRLDGVSGQIEDAQQAIFACCHELSLFCRIPAAAERLIRVRVVFCNCELLAGRIVLNLDHVSAVCSAGHEQVLRLELVPTDAERGLVRYRCAMAQLFVLEAIINDQVSIDRGQRNFSLRRMPTNRVDDFLRTFRLY